MIFLEPASSKTDAHKFEDTSAEVYKGQMIKHDICNVSMYGRFEYGICFFSFRCYQSACHVFCKWELGCRCEASICLLYTQCCQRRNACFNVHCPLYALPCACTGHI